MCYGCADVLIGCGHVLKRNPDPGRWLLFNSSGSSNEMIQGAVTMIHFLAHGKGDNVAVAVVDIGKGDHCEGLNMETKQRFAVDAGMDIPLGHKIALQDFNEGDTIIKYDHDIGRVVRAIKKGEHVHVHNVKTKRW